MTNIGLILYLILSLMWLYFLEFDEMKRVTEDTMFPLFMVAMIVMRSVYVNSFPSLLTTNATLAVVIDKEYLAEEYEHIKSSIDKYVSYVKREIIKHGGINIQYYYWSSINVKRDISAILSIASCGDTWKLFKESIEDNILLIAISETDCPRLPLDQAITIPLIKKGEEMPQMLLDLRSANVFSWKSAVVIHDNTLDRDMITKVVSSLTTDTSNIKYGAAAISLLKLEVNATAESIREILSHISMKKTGINFLVIVSIEVVTIVMDIVKSLDLVSTESQWLYVIPDTNHSLVNITQAASHLKEGDNVAFVYNITTADVYCKVGLKCHMKELLLALGRALDVAIVDEFELASQVSEEEWEAIRPSKRDRMLFLLNLMKMDLLQRGTCENCTTWQLTAGDTRGLLYNKAPQHYMAKLIEVGYWRPSDGLNLTDTLFPHVVNGFRGRMLPLVSFHNPPWQIVEVDNAGIVKYTGLVFDIIDELAKSMNFTYKVEIFGEHPSRNNLTDAADSGLSITYAIPDQIIEMVHNKQVAFAACAFTIKDETKLLVNFTSPISTQTYTFLIARPKELSRAMLFISPFTRSTWLCLCAAILTMGPTLYYIHKLSPVYEYKGINTKGLHSVQNCIWYMYGALLQQGGMYLPIADSARLIVGSWWLVVLVLTTTYCGNLVAFLTFPNIDKPIDTIDELLLHQDTVTWSIPPGSFFEQQIKEANEPKYQLLFRGALKHKLSNDAMLEKIEHGKHVLLDWRLKLQYMMKKRFLIDHKCALSLGSDDFFEEQLGLIIAQDSPYINAINAKIKRLHQVGLIQKWLQNYLPKRDKCFKVRSTAVNNHTVNLDDMQGSFIVLLLGFSAATFLICFEKFWNKHKLKRNKKIVQPFTS